MVRASILVAIFLSCFSAEGQVWGTGQGGTGTSMGPSSGQIPIGQGGSGNPYAPETMSGPCTLAPTGALSCPTLAPLASPTFTGTVTLPDGTTVTGSGFTFSSHVFPASAPVLATNASRQPIAGTTTGTGSTVALSVGPTFTGTVTMNAETINQTGGSDGLININENATNQIGLAFNGAFVLSNISGLPLVIADPSGNPNGIALETSNGSSPILFENTVNLTQAGWDPNDNLCVGTLSLPGSWPSDCTAPFQQVEASAFLVNGVPALTGYTASSTAMGGSAMTAGQTITNTVTISGITNHMEASCSPFGGGYPGAGFVWNSSVTASNTVTIYLTAVLAGTPTSTRFTCRVIQ